MAKSSDSGRVTLCEKYSYFYGKPNIYKIMQLWSSIGVSKTSLIHPAVLAQFARESKKF